MAQTIDTSTFIEGGFILKKTWTALALTSVLLLSPISASANTQVFTDVTDATKNAILKKIEAANIMEAYYDDEFWPDESVTRGELADIITRAYKLYNVRPAKQFNDVDEYTDHADAIQTLYRAGIIDGTADGNFNPYDEVKRTHVAKILANLLKLKPSTTTKFKDVPKSDANNGYIGALVNKGIIAGYPDGTFKPNQTVTRMNMATFIYRALYGKEQQIANKKITSNTVYAATKLKAANYKGNYNTSYYIEFDSKGNSKQKVQGITQKFTKDHIYVYQENTEWTLLHIDLRDLVEFKPNYKDSIRDLVLPEQMGMWSHGGSYTTTPYFNQTVTINKIKFTGVLKVVQNVERYSEWGGDYEESSHEIVFYLKEGYGLLAYKFDGDLQLSISGYKLR